MASYKSLGNTYKGHLPAIHVAIEKFQDASLLQEQSAVLDLLIQRDLLDRIKLKYQLYQGHVIRNAATPEESAAEKAELLHFLKEYIATLERINCLLRIAKTHWQVNSANAEVGSPQLSYHNTTAVNKHLGSQRFLSPNSPHDNNCLTTSRQTGERSAPCSISSSLELCDTSALTTYTLSKSCLPDPNVEREPQDYVLNKTTSVSSLVKPQRKNVCQTKGHFAQDIKKLCPLNAPKLVSNKYTVHTISAKRPILDTVEFMSNYLNQLESISSKMMATNVALVSKSCTSIVATPPAQRAVGSQPRFSAIGHPSTIFTDTGGSIGTKAHAPLVTTCNAKQSNHTDANDSVQRCPRCSHHRCQKADGSFCQLMHCSSCVASDSPHSRLSLQSCVVEPPIATVLNTVIMPNAVINQITSTILQSCNQKTAHPRLVNPKDLHHRSESLIVGTLVSLCFGCAKQKLNVGAPSEHPGWVTYLLTHGSVNSSQLWPTQLSQIEEVRITTASSNWILTNVAIIPTILKLPEEIPAWFMIANLRSTTYPMSLCCDKGALPRMDPGSQSQEMTDEPLTDYTSLREWLNQQPRQIFPPQTVWLNILKYIMSHISNRRLYETLHHDKVAVCMLAPRAPQDSKDQIKGRKESSNDEFHRNREPPRATTTLSNLCVNNNSGSLQVAHLQIRNTPRIQDITASRSQGFLLNSELCVSVQPVSKNFLLHSQVQENEIHSSDDASTCQFELPSHPRNGRRGKRNASSPTYPANCKSRNKVKPTIFSTHLLSTCIVTKRLLRSLSETSLFRIRKSSADSPVNSHGNLLCIPWTNEV